MPFTQFIQGGMSFLARRRKTYTTNEEIEDLKRNVGDQSPVLDVFKKSSKGSQNDGS